MAILVPLFFSLQMLICCLPPSSSHANPPLGLDSRLYKPREGGCGDEAIMMKSRREIKNSLLEPRTEKNQYGDREQITDPALTIEKLKEQEQERKRMAALQQPYMMEADTATIHQQNNQNSRRYYEKDEAANSGTTKALGLDDVGYKKNKIKIVKTTTLQYNNEIRQLAENGNWTKALITWSHMRRSSVRADIHTFKYILTALARAGQVRKASQIFESMGPSSSSSSSSSGLRRTTVVYNVMLNAHAHAHTWEQALKLLHDFQRDAHLQPDVVSYTTVMCAMTRANQSLQAIELFNKMKKEESSTNNNVLKPNTLAYNTLFTACRQKKFWMKSLRAFARMRQEKVPCDLKTYTRLMSISEEAAQWRFAMDILQSMYQSHEGTTNDVNPTVRIFNSAISACGKARRMDLVVSLMRKMESEFLRPDGYTYRQFLQTQRRVVYGSSRVLSKRRNASHPAAERHISQKMNRRCSDHLFA
mmetsp:Transcript_19327/g.27211  ORF Transcript_19327/g.27211 Transcript_19327/m.27211 type:complete len:475 (-) Transcript_19327:54-1478(-)